MTSANQEENPKTSYTYRLKKGETWNTLTKALTMDDPGGGPELDPNGRLHIDVVIKTPKVKLKKEKNPPCIVGLCNGLMGATPQKKLPPAEPPGGSGQVIVANNQALQHILERIEFLERQIKNLQGKVTQNEASYDEGGSTHSFESRAYGSEMSEMEASPQTELSQSPIEGSRHQLEQQRLPPMSRRQSEQKRLSDTSRQFDRRSLDQQRQAEIQKQPEMKRQSESQRQTEIKRQSESQRLSDLQRQEMQRQAEVQRQAEAQRQAEMQRQAEVQRQSEQRRLSDAQRQPEPEIQSEPQRLSPRSDEKEGSLKLRKPKSPELKSSPILSPTDGKNTPEKKVISGSSCKGFKDNTTGEASGNETCHRKKNSKPEEGMTVNRDPGTYNYEEEDDEEIPRNKLYTYRVEIPPLPLAPDQRWYTAGDPPLRRNEIDGDRSVDWWRVPDSKCRIKAKTDCLYASRRETGPAGEEWLYKPPTTSSAETYFGRMDKLGQKSSIENMMELIGRSSIRHEDISHDDSEMDMVSGSYLTSWESDEERPRSTTSYRYSDRTVESEPRFRMPNWDLETVTVPVAVNPNNIQMVTDELRKAIIEQMQNMWENCVKQLNDILTASIGDLENEDDDDDIKDLRLSPQ